MPLYERVGRGNYLVESTPVKIHDATYETLRKLQEALPGKPTLLSLIDEAVKLLAEKYLKKEEENANP